MSATCKYCHTSGLSWDRTTGRSRLVDGNGQKHFCPVGTNKPFKLRRRLKDDSYSSRDHYVWHGGANGDVEKNKTL